MRNHKTNDKYPNITDLHVCLDRIYHFLKLKKTYQMAETKTANLSSLLFLFEVCFL